MEEEMQGGNSRLRFHPHLSSKPIHLRSAPSVCSRFV
jgi:hypothetical protein